MVPTSVSLQNGNSPRTVIISTRSRVEWVSQIQAIAMSTNDCRGICVLDAQWCKSNDLRRKED